MPEPSTLVQVALAAGVSPSTVSRILTGNAVVSDEKRRRVLDAVERLGYRPNAIAQGLRLKQSMTIGVLAEKIGSSFYDEVFLGIESGIEGTGYQAFFGAGHWNPEKESVALEAFLKWRVDAMIVVGGFMSDQTLRGFAQRVPLVVAQREVVDLEQQCVTIDNERGGHLGTRHLIDLGHRRIAHIGGPQANHEARLRLAGYRRALEEAGLAFDPRLVVEGTFTNQSGVIGMESILMRGTPFSAVFAANDSMALGARLALYRRHIRVPEDVSLVGFDNTPDSGYITPPLTSVRQPAFEMGKVIAATAINLMRGEPSRAQQLEVALVVRESSSASRR